MRDLIKTIAHIERGLFRGLERRAALPPKMMKPKPSVWAWRAPATSTVYSETVYPEQVFRPKCEPKDKLKG
jgi:hypothetical protein